MALSIIDNQGILEVKGNVIGENAAIVKHHFEQLISSRESIVMSVDHVNKIDASGVNVLTNLHEKAMKSNIILRIIGQENKNILEAFGRNNYVLQRDMV